MNLRNYLLLRINTDIDNLESRFSDLLNQIVDSENTESALQGMYFFIIEKIKWL